MIAAWSLLLLGCRVWAVSDRCAEYDNPSLLQNKHAQEKLNVSKASPAYWLQVATKNKDGCYTNNDVWAEARGNGKSTGWMQNLASQVGGTNFRKSDRVVYNLDCLNPPNCPTAEEVTEICLKVKVGLFSDGAWCPTDVMVFTKPDFKKVGQQMSWPEKWEKDQDVCQQLDKVAPLPTPAGTLVQEIMYWADFGLAREQKDYIVRGFPIPEGIENIGAFSLYQGYGDYVKNQGGKPAALFLLGDNGYLGGNENQGKVMDGIHYHGESNVPSDMIFPAIGNHDVNAPSGCAVTDLGRCYYGDKTSVTGQSAETAGLNFEAWKQRWISDFPGLAGTGKVVIPPGNHSWLAPVRYNVDLGAESSVYFIVGLVAGTYRNTWGPDQPPEAFPASIDNWEDQGNLECEFVDDSVAHGKSLGKTIFIYLTHDGPRQMGTVDFCGDAYKQLDVWLYGHEHFMGLSAPRGQVVEQQKDNADWYPVRMLLGNGGFDEGSIDYDGLAANFVSFVTMKEYKMADGGTELYFQAYDTCISATNCACKLSCGHDIPPWSCWDKCLAIDGGIHGIKATKSKDEYKFIYKAKR